MTYYTQNCPQAFTAPTAGFTGYLKQMVCQWLYNIRLRYSIAQERRYLASMSDEMLKDIGIDRIEANRESTSREIPATRRNETIS